MAVRIERFSLYAQFHNGIGRNIKRLSLRHYIKDNIGVKKDLLHPLINFSFMNLLFALSPFKSLASRWKPLVSPINS